MFWFPLVNIIFLGLIYRVHRRIFWITAFLEMALYTAGVTYVEMRFASGMNQFLYYLALTGVGLIIGVGAFFLAISLNHKHLYSELDQKKE